MNKFLTQSRFLFDEQNNVITPGLQIAISSIGQSSIMTDKNVQELKITSPSIKYTIKNDKVVVTQTSLKKQNKKQQMVLSYPQRIERAKKLQEKREAKRQKQLRKMERQERKFQKMMEKLKKEQQKKQKEKKKNKKKSKSIKSSKSGSSSESSSSSVSSSKSEEQEQESSIEKEQENQEESSEISSSESSDEDTEDTNLSALNESLFNQNKVHSVQDSQQKVINENPFENTPHQEIVAKYMFEAPKQLQTLNPQLKGFLPVLNKKLNLMNPNLMINLENQSIIAATTNDGSQNIINNDILLNQSLLQNSIESSKNTLAFDFDGIKQNKAVFFNNFKNVDQSIQNNKLTFVDSKLLNEFQNLNVKIDKKQLLKNENFQQTRNINTLAQSIVSETGTPLNVQFDQNISKIGSQFNETSLLKSIDFTYSSKQNIQHNLKKSIHFKNELQNYRMSQDIPAFLKNQKLDQKNYFKRQFDKTQLDYQFLLQSPQQKQMLNMSIDFGILQEKNNLLPNINKSTKFQKDDQNWRVWNSPKIDPQQFVEIKPTQKAIMENLNHKKVSTNLNLNYLKSPKLKNEIVKCTQLYYSNMESSQIQQISQSIKKVGKSTFQNTFQANSKIAFQNMLKVQNNLLPHNQQHVAQINSQSTQIQNSQQIQEQTIQNSQSLRKESIKEEYKEIKFVDSNIKSKANIQSIRNLEDIQQKMKKKFENEQVKDNQKYEQFIKEYLKPHKIVEDPINNIQNYLMGQVQDTIDLTDNLIKYKEIQQSKADTNESFKRKKSQKLLVISKIKVDNQIHRRNTFLDNNINNLRCDQNRVFSSENSQSLSSRGSMEPKKRVFFGKKQQSQAISSSVSASNDKQDEKQKQIIIPPIKHQNLCIVEKIALNFLYEVYSSDNRFQIDPSEENRVQYINVNEQNLYMKDKDYYESIIQQQMQILCSHHGDMQFDDKQQKQQIIKKFDQFYQNLLNDSQTKISKEKLCKTFLDFIMDKKNYEFKDLRLKILNKNGQDQNETFKLLRDLNPEIFLKSKSYEDPHMKLIESSNREKIELKSHQKNNLYSYNTNKQIFVNKQIFDNLVRGMVESEIQEKTNNIKQKLLRKYSKNEIIDFNINKRKLEEKQKKLVTKLTKKNLVDGLNLSQKDLKVAEQIKKMKEALRENLQQRMMNYASFQKTAKQDILKQLSSQDIGNFLKQDPFDNINSQNAIQLLQTNLGKSGSPLQIQQNDKQFLLDIVNKMNNSASLESFNRDEKKSETAMEVFKKDYETLKFYAIQKQYNDQPSSTPNAQIQYYLKLKQKCCLTIPYFVKIQKNTLNIQNQYLNTETIYALTDFLLAQTKLLQQKKKLQKSGIDIFEDRSYKELWDLQSDQIYVKHLIIDDCNMKDEDFAIFLGAISIQNKLKSLTYQNNEFGQKSLLALGEIIQQKDKEEKNEDLQNQFQKQMSKSKKEINKFKSISLSNLKTDQSTIQYLLEYIDNANESNPLLQIKLSELDLNNSNSVYYLCNQFYVNKKLQKFNIKGSRINFRNLHVLTECLAQESQLFEQSRRQEDLIRLQYLNLSYISMLEGNEKTKYSDKIVQNLSEFLKNAYVLVHLDISGMNLRDKIIPILKSIKQNQQQTLVSIHMSDNLFSLKQKDEILFIMNIDTQKYHYLHDNINVQEQDPMEIALLQKLFIKEDKIKQISNQFYKKQRTTFSSQEQREKAFESDILNQQIGQQVNEQKQNIRQDQLNGSTRRDKKIEDPMILTRKLGLPELIFNENKYCKQELSDVNSNEKWSYFNSKVGDDCYVCQKYNYIQLFYNRKKISDEFQKIQNIDFIQMLVDCYEINQIESLKSGSPLLISSLNNWVLTRLVNIKIYSQILKGDDDEFAKKLIRKQQVKQKKILELEEKHLSEKYKNQKKDSHMSQQQKQQVQKEQEILKNLEDKINFLKDDKKYIKQELNIVKRKTKLLQRSVSGMNQSKILGLTMKKDKSQQSQIIEETEENDLNEILEDNEWFDIITNCPKYKDKLININFPQDDTVNGDDLFVFAGYVKPGLHVIIVFDPVKEEFFKREIIVEVRKEEILIQNAKKQQDEGNNENIKTVASDDIVEQKDSVFEKWKHDDDQRIQNIFLSDFYNKQFSKDDLGVGKQQFFEIQNYISQIYFQLIQAHIIYLSNDKVYPQSNIKKLYNFVNEIGIIAQNKDQNIQKKYKFISQKHLIEILSEYFNIHMQKNEKYQQFCERILKNEEIVITRYQFVQIILIVSVQNYEMNKIKLKEIQFNQYFEYVTLQKLQQYTSKNAYQNQNFRKQILWQEPVPQFLFQNKLQLDKIFQHYKINNKFTINSAYKLLKDANINLQIDFTNLDHTDHVNRLFLLSKQTVQNDSELYMYQFLEEIEFYEFISRVAFQYYNQWFYSFIDLTLLKEEIDVLSKYLKKSSNDIKKLNDDQKLLYERIQQRSMALESLQFKIYCLLMNKLNILIKNQQINTSLLINEMKDYQQRRQVIQNFDVDKFLILESEQLQQNQLQEETLLNNQSSIYLENIFNQIVKEEAEDMNGDQQNNDSFSLSPNKFGDKSKSSVSNSSQDKSSLSKRKISSKKKERLQLSRNQNMRINEQSTQK